MALAEVRQQHPQTVLLLIKLHLLLTLILSFSISSALIDSFRYFMTTFLPLYSTKELFSIDKKECYMDFLKIDSKNSPLLVQEG